MQYTRTASVIPGITLLTSKKHKVNRMERLSHTPDVQLLGGPKSIDLSSRLNPGEKLYIQMRIEVFMEGDERAIDQLYGEHGAPVSSLRHVKGFNTLRGAQTVANMLLTRTTMEYKVLSVDIRTESAVTVGRKEIAI